MAKLEENIFKPEEELQGYIAGEADADTFQLAENDEYPGMVPDFGSEPEEIEVKPEVTVFEDEKPNEQEEPEEVENIEEFVAPQDTTDENIEEELDLNIDIDDDDLSDVWSAFGNTDDDNDDEEDLLPETETDEEVELPEQVGIKTAEEVVPEQADIETTEGVVPEQAGIETAEEIEPTETTASSAIDVDEFKQFLEAQKEKTQAKRTIEEDDDVLPNRDSKAEPVFVEITGDDFEEPKKEPQAEPKAKQKKEPTPVIEKKEKPKVEKVQKEEKKRKGIAGWLVAAVLFLLISLFTIGLLMTDNDSAFLKLVSSMTSNVQNQIIPADSTQISEKEVEMVEDSTQKEEKIVDFSGTTPDEEVEETADTIENMPEPEAEQDLVVETKPAPVQKTAIPKRRSKTKSVKTAEPAPKAEKQGIIKRVYEPKALTKNNIATPSAKESMIVKTTSLVEKKQTTKPKAIKQDAIEKQTLPSLDRNKGVFSVQVYSTLSKKDATDKVKQLKNMNIKNVYISEYRKRDVLWYRVRYGEFESYQQAQKAAKNRGFSDAWIDRIK